MKTAWRIPFASWRSDRIEARRHGSNCSTACTDGNVIEGVLMRYHYGNTLCVSTQVGCRMGCAFCASTLEGCVRNLTRGRNSGPGRRAPTGALGPQEPQRADNIVLMGSGEPLDNYDNVVKFLRLVNDAKGLNIVAAQRVAVDLRTGAEDVPTLPRRACR